MKFDSITTITGIHDPDSIIARILTGRGIPTDQHDSFLHPQHPDQDGAYNSGIQQDVLEKIVNRIRAAKEHKESVVIYADYDVDGITSAAILWRTLNQLGVAVMPFIPQRSQGYGFSDVGLEAVLAHHKPSLIIAVDHGINESAHITQLKRKGVGVIVLDHHEQNDGEQLKDAYAVIHTTLLSAAGISYIVAHALADASLRNDHLVLAGIASLADVIPQRGLARALSYHALRSLSRTTIPGLAALMAQAGLKLDKDAYTSYDIGYLIAPRINAAGRLGDPLVALRSLCTTNPTKAREYAQSLELLNRKRQDMLKESLPIAYQLAQQQADRRFRCISSPLFDEGIIGLLAGRLMRDLQVPVLVGAERNGIIKGSARSIDGVNMIPLMQHSNSLLLSFGGHEKAGGFSLSKDNLDAFITSLDTALTASDQIVFEPIQHADVALSLANITTPLAEALESLEPYGEQNQKPLFISHDVSIVDRQPVGRSGGSHLRVVLKDLHKGTIVKGMYFSAPQAFMTMPIDKPVSIVYQVECNRWKGPEAQVMLQSVY